MNHVIIKEQPAVYMILAKDKDISQGVVNPHYYYEIPVECTPVVDEDTIDAMFIADASPSFQFLREEEEA